MGKRVDPHGVQLTRLIIGQMAIQKKTYDDLAKVTGLCRQNVSAKVVNPDMFRYGELCEVCKYLNIPAEEFRAAVGY